MKDDMRLAVRWREATRAVFKTYLNAGYEVREFGRGDVTSDYLLVRTDEAAGPGPGPAAGSEG